MPVVDNVHGNDPMQQNIVKLLRKDSSTATVLAPPIEAEGVTFTYFQFGVEGEQSLIVTELAPGDPSPLTDLKMTLASGRCKEYGKAAKIPVITLANTAPGIDLRGRLSAQCYDEVKLQEEIDFKTVMYATGNYSSSQAATAAWNAASGVKIRSDIINAARKVAKVARGKYPNVIVMPPGAWDVVRQDPTLVGTSFNYAGGMDVVTNGFFPKSLEGLRLVVPGYTFNSANPGQTASFDNVWQYTGGSVGVAAVFFQEPTPAKESPSWLHTFYPKTYGMNGEMTDSWYDNKEKSWYVDYRSTRAFQVVTPEYACVITGI